MNTVTLVATDLDGTFLNSKKEVSKLNREAISALNIKESYLHCLWKACRNSTRNVGRLENRR